MSEFIEIGSVKAQRVLIHGIHQIKAGSFDYDALRLACYEIHDKPGSYNYDVDMRIIINGNMVSIIQQRYINCGKIDELNTDLLNYYLRIKTDHPSYLNELKKEHDDAMLCDIELKLMIKRIKRYDS